MQGHQEGWACNKDELEGPETGVGDREVIVVADVLTSRLAGVTVKVFLLISPYLLACHQEHQEPENKNNSKPDSAKSSGILVDSAEKTLQETPVHCDKQVEAIAAD
ncbi:hypothetical protein NL108_002985 [Boleophthalmus pectinirostris]|nr:hypothetical protein NL108_002985 [Boleophthalmus pectinirostris]